MENANMKISLEGIKTFLAENKDIGNSRCVHSRSLKSHYAFIHFFKFSQQENESLVIKDIMPWHLEELSGNNREETIRFINASTHHFRERLRQFEVPLTNAYDVYSYHDRVFHVFPYVGRSLDAIFRDEQKSTVQKKEFRSILAQVIQNIAKVLQYSGDPIIGLDAQLSNFCLDEFNNIVYIDVVPALCEFQGIVHVHYPNPLDIFSIQREIVRKFKPLGILRRLRFSLMIIDASLETCFYSAIRMAMGGAFFAEVYELFNSLQDVSILSRTKPEVLQIIERNLGDTDSIREIALRLIPHRTQNRKEELKKVFDLSSDFSAYNIPKSERLPQLRTLLLKYI